MESVVRGSRLGATSWESESSVVEYAERIAVHYDCPRGHSQRVIFAAEAEIPALWQCRCGAEALRRHSSRPPVTPVRSGRTPWDMLIERRSIADLEQILAERLDEVRAMRGERPRKSA